MIRMRIYSRLEDAPCLLDFDLKRREKAVWRVSESLYWLEIARQALGHRCYYITAWDNETLLGILPLAEIKGYFLGSFLLSVPYVNWTSMLTVSPYVENILLETALLLAEKRGVRYLEIRKDINPTDRRWLKRSGHKVVMLLNLPKHEEELWQQLGSKVRNQIRKGQKNRLQIISGNREMIGDFYKVYVRNTHWLGTPAYPLSFITAIIEYFAKESEIVLVSDESKVVAGAILLHGRGITELPLAACLPEYRSSCANMLLYWELLRRSMHRGSKVFDFGRCTPNSGSFQFKKQWGAKPIELVWSYYTRGTDPNTWAKEHPRFAYWQDMWKRLPLSLAQWLGGYIIKGLPV